MTAQEAAIPHPNEMGLLGGFVRSHRRQRRKERDRGFKSFLGKVHGKFRAAKEQVRKYRLFAKGKTKAAKDRMVAQMTSIVEGINQNLGKALAAAAEHRAASCAATPWSHTASLSSCTRPWASWCRRSDTGCARDSSRPARSSTCTFPQLYSIVRGKVGKSVEFGLSWGITRLRGGFVLATMAGDEDRSHGCKLCRACGRRSRGAVRQGTTCLRLRPGWVQHGEREAPAQAWRARYWIGPPRPDAVGGRGQGEGPTHQGAGDGRRARSAPSSAPNTDSTARRPAQPR